MWFDLTPYNDAALVKTVDQFISSYILLSKYMQHRYTPSSNSFACAQWQQFIYMPSTKHLSLRPSLLYTIVAFYMLIKQCAYIWSWSHCLIRNTLSLVCHITCTPEHLWQYTQATCDDTCTILAISTVSDLKLIVYTMHNYQIYTHPIYIECMYSICVYLQLWLYIYIPLGEFPRVTYNCHIIMHPLSQMLACYFWSFVTLNE